MATKLIDRKLTFAVPPLGAQGSLLPQQAALGTIARIRQTAPDYFNVMVQEHANPLGELRLYIVRKAAGHEDGERNTWIVERPNGHGDYEQAATFRFAHLREALCWAVRYVTADWIVEVREGGQAR